MVKKIFIVFSIIVFCPLISFSQTGSVIVISIDSLHPDAIGIVNPENIIKLMNKGVFTLSGKSVSPPKTLISHTAMVTGFLPEESGYNYNIWKPGDPTVKGSTVFEDAKKAGFKTYYIYSKQKLGFLENKFVDKSIFGKDESIQVAEKIIKNEKKPFFMFLHISGLDEVGPKYGFLSKDYLDEFRLIDEELKGIIDHFVKLDKSSIIVTSDHSGHEKEHGTEHPEDYKIPLILFSKLVLLSDIKDSPYRTYQLRGILKRVFDVAVFNSVVAK